MGTLTAKIEKINQTKQAIKEAIEEKGQEIDSDVFETYPDKIRAINCGVQIEPIEAYLAPQYPVSTIEGAKILLNPIETYLPTQETYSVDVHSLLSRGVLGDAYYMCLSSDSLFFTAKTRIRENMSYHSDYLGGFYFIKNSDGTYQRATNESSGEDIPIVVYPEPNVLFHAYFYTGLYVGIYKNGSFREKNIYSWSSSESYNSYRVPGSYYLPYVGTCMDENHVVFDLQPERHFLLVKKSDYELDQKNYITNPQQDKTAAFYYKNKELWAVTGTGNRFGVKVEANGSETILYNGTWDEKPADITNVNAYFQFDDGSYSLLVDQDNKIRALCLTQLEDGTYTYRENEAHTAFINASLGYGTQNKLLNIMPSRKRNNFYVQILDASKKIFGFKIQEDGSLISIADRFPDNTNYQTDYAQIATYDGNMFALPGTIGNYGKPVYLYYTYEQDALENPYKWVAEPMNSQFLLSSSLIGVSTGEKIARDSDEENGVIVNYCFS